MKQFEHEVLSFDTSNKKGMASMKTALSLNGVLLVTRWYLLSLTGRPRARLMFF